MTKRNLLIAIPMIFVVLNGVAYLFFSKTRTSPTVLSPDAAAGRRTAPGGGEHKATPEEEEAARNSRAQARRESGLAALEAGDYDKALIHFTEAKALIGDKANVGDLLKVTEDLRKDPPDSTKPRPSAMEPRPRKVAIRSLGSSRRTVREGPDLESPPPPPASAGGLLIVATTPRGMLVHVDDTPVDLTPMKTKVKAGMHRVALLDGDRKVYETTVDIREGGTVTLLRDLTAERALEAPRPTGATAVTPPPMGEEALRPLPAAPVAATATRATMQSDITSTSRSATRQVGSQDGTQVGSQDGTQVGTLEIASPGLYGVVWVNGRPRGYPPLAVRDLPAGPVKVEVRVNGVQKRVATALVKAGSTASVRLGTLGAMP